MKVDDHKPPPVSTEGRDMDEGDLSVVLYSGTNQRLSVEGKLYSSKSVRSTDVHVSLGSTIR